mmetsp:Transcript_6125/g.8906  ORF Transcript_6125/g.8906 Transcript_6125/m.8906 type:complete len:447 (-) Transcript_6125:658-1998(-)
MLSSKVFKGYRTTCCRYFFTAAAGLNDRPLKRPDVSCLFTTTANGRHNMRCCDSIKLPTTNSIGRNYGTNTRDFDSGVEGMKYIRDEKYLSRLENLYANGKIDHHPSIVTYNKSMQEVGGKFNYSNDAVQRIERIFRRVENSPHVRPDTKSYTIVISALARSKLKDAATKAENYFAEMILRHKEGDWFINPDEKVYTAVIRAWAKCRQKGAAQRAETMLKLLESSYTEGSMDIELDSLAYNVVIEAWSTSNEDNAPYRALSILRRMDEVHATGFYAVKPNIYSYLGVINAFARSKDEEKAQHAKNVLHELIGKYENGDRSLKPKFLAFNGVIQACASTYDRTGSRGREVHAVRIALEVFDALCKASYAYPDFTTYLLMMKVCAKIPDQEHRHRTVENIFHLCCKDGLLGDQVIEIMKDAVRSDFFHLLIKQDATFPSSWTSNLRRT